MRKLPRSSVKPSNTVPVASCTARTATPGRTPAVESFTVPEIVASWATTTPGNARQDSTIKMNGPTSPRLIDDLLPQAPVTDKSHLNSRGFPRSRRRSLVLVPSVVLASLLPLFVPAAEDDICSPVSFPHGALPLLVHLLPPVIDAQLPWPRIDLRIVYRRDVDEVIRRGRGPALDEVKGIGMEAADNLQPRLI